MGKLRCGGEVNGILDMVIGLGTKGRGGEGGWGGHETIGSTRTCPMFLRVGIISLELIRIKCFIFSDNPSPFMRHEIARLTEHPSHAVLFNFRWGARVSIKERWGVKVSGCPDTLGAIDGVEYLAGVLENAVIFLFTGSLNHLRSQSPAHVYCILYTGIKSVMCSIFLF